jgi:hypothetical protein
VASPVAVAVKRARAEIRLRKVLGRIAAASGVEYVPPVVSSARFPTLYAAQLVEGAADLLERVADKTALPQEQKR